MTANEEVIRKLLESAKQQIDLALSLMVKEEPEEPAAKGPRYLGDEDGPQG